MRYISHEVRTPLNTVVMGLRVLHDDLAAKAYQDCMTTVKDTQESCQIAIGILNEMLLYDKVESGLLVLEREYISSAVDFVRGAIAPFQVQVPKHPR